MQGPFASVTATQAEVAASRAGDDVVPGADVVMVRAFDPARHLGYRSTRGHTDVSWALTLSPAGSGTRVHLRLRLGPVRRVRLAQNVGGLFDALTIAGMAAGVRERVG